MGLALSKERMRKRTHALVILIAILPVFIFCLPMPNRSRKGIDPSLKTMKYPLKKVVVEYYFDGGSVGLLVVDADGKTNEFALPVSYSGSKRQYTNFHAGELWLNRTNISLAEPLDDRTRRYLFYLMEVKGKRDAHRTLALLYMRGAPRDYVPLVEANVKDLFQ